LALSAQSEEENPLSVFLYALKAPETKKQYPRRLKVKQLSLILINSENNMQ
jgi:hypothetical protein